MELRQKIQAIQNLIRVKNFLSAIVNCKKLLKKYPNNSYIYNLCGLALQGEGKIPESIEFFSIAIHHEPENLAAMNNLANSFKAIHKLDKAEQLYARIIEKDTQNLKALNNYGNLKQTLNDFEGAIELYLKAIKINPEEINILFSLASSYQIIGNFEKSKAYADKVLILNSKYTSAHKLISGFTNYKKEENKKHLNLMEILSKDNSLDKGQKVDLFYALGKAYEDIKDYQNSFKYLKEANFLKKKHTKYQLEKDEKLFNNIIKVFNEIDFNEFQKTSKEKQIIFICGMPRSGTTLVEQIIASHNEVNGAGELVYLQSTIKKIFFNELSINKQKIIDEGLTEKNTLEFEYMKLLNPHNFSSNIVTDKAPPNFRWIGFMKIFFPNCKIIHCFRNPKDNCLSLFKNNFASSDMEWAHDQKDIAEYYNLYLKIMRFWKTKLSDSICDVEYENIVNSPEDEIKRIIKFCNLDWDSNCLNFHKNKKTPIQTVSVSQARQPIYKSSVNSNSFYSEYLQEMYNILDIN